MGVWAIKITRGKPAIGRTLGSRDETRALGRPANEFSVERNIGGCWVASVYREVLYPLARLTSRSHLIRRYSFLDANARLTDFASWPYRIRRVVHALAKESGE